jgi:iron uptake system component EfeO
VSVTGSTDSALTPGILPVTRNDLYDPTQQYSAWISSRLPILAQDAEALLGSVNSGDRVAAQHDWVTAHVEYEQLGAAYGAFGDADAAINGTVAPGLTASTDPNFTGFHRIESILWDTSTTTSDAAPFAAKLLSDITDLQTAFGKARLDPLALGIRAHEILENAVQVQLNNAADEGSGTTFATLDANVAGTRQAVDPLRPILSARGFDLAALDDSLDRASALVDSYRRPDGSWTPLTELTTAQRQAVNARFDETVELLAPIAAICDIRRSADS